MPDYTDINAKVDDIRAQISNLKELISNSYSDVFNGGLIFNACLNACDEVWDKMWTIEEFNNVLSDALEKWHSVNDEADAPKRRKGTPLEENDSGYNCEDWIP